MYTHTETFSKIDKNLRNLCTATKRNYIEEGKNPMKTKQILIRKSEFIRKRKLKKEKCM